MLQHYLNFGSTETWWWRLEDLLRSDRTPHAVFCGLKIDLQEAVKFSKRTFVDRFYIRGGWLSGPFLSRPYLSEAGWFWAEYFENSASIDLVIHEYDIQPKFTSQERHWGENLALLELPNPHELGSSQPNIYPLVFLFFSLRGLIVSES